jgi:hypothetical protein
MQNSHELRTCILSQHLAEGIWGNMKELSQGCLASKSRFSFRLT